MTLRRPAFRALALAGLLVLTAAAPAPTPSLADTPLRARVAPPDEAIVQAYAEAGAADAKPHQLTDREWAAVEAALDALPRLHRDILRRHLVHLSFIDAPQSAGTALTRRLDAKGGEPLFDITLRADVLNRSLADFLNRKESQLFDPDPAGTCLRIDAGGASALTYVLLHEASHVVDGVLGITAGRAAPFQSTIWADYRQLAPPYDASPIAHTAFRREPRLPLSRAGGLYAALERSPFVSLYATASAGEDFADLVAWRELTARHGAWLRIEVRDARGRLITRAQPLRSAELRRRFAAIEAVLARAAAKG